MKSMMGTVVLLVLLVPGGERNIGKEVPAVEGAKMVSGSPSIAAGGGLLAAAWATPKDKHHLDGYVAVSKDGGKTWEKPVRFNGDAPVGAQYQNGPKVGMDDRGALHLFWSQEKVYYTRSTDGGKTFEPVTMVADQGEPEMANMTVTGKGIVHGAWLSNQGAADPHAKHIAYVRSEDGKTFTKPVDITKPLGHGVCECCTMGLAAADRGVIVAFRNDEAGVRDIFAVESSDGGTTWGVPAEVAKQGWNMNT